MFGPISSSAPVDFGGGGPSSAIGGTAGGSTTGNRSFVFNNASSGQGMDAKTIAIIGGVTLLGLYLWKRK